MNLLAFGRPTLWGLAAPNYRLIRAAAGAGRKFFQPLGALTAYWCFPSWDPLMDFMRRGQEVGPYAAQKSSTGTSGRRPRQQRARPRISPIASRRRKSSLLPPSLRHKHGL